jgi:hypothetical protein
MTSLEAIFPILHKPEPMSRPGRVSNSQFANGSAVWVGRDREWPKITIKHLPQL